MACQPICTCGKHMIVDTSKAVTIPVQAAGCAPNAYPVTFALNTGRAEQPAPITFKVNP